MGNLVDRVLPEIDQPTALAAQSMGGIDAVCAALERPERVTHLVLTITLGGVDMYALGAQDWRPDFAVANPNLPRWLLDDRTDLTARLSDLLPRAELHVFPGAGHDLGFIRVREVARLIDWHLMAG